MATTSSTVTLLALCYMITTAIATNEWFHVSDNNTHWRNAVMDCHPDRNCYIRCSAVGACQNTKISCNSTICDLKCTKQACLNTTLNIISPNNNTKVSVSCEGYNSCYKLKVNAKASAPEFTSSFSISSTLPDEKPALTSAGINVEGFQTVEVLNGNASRNLQCNGTCLSNIYTLKDIGMIKVLEKFNEASFRPQTFNIIDSQSINFTCIGEQSCHGNTINVTHHSQEVNSTLSIDCHGTSACQNLNVAVSSVDKLNMFCFDGIDVCLNAILSISPLFDHTHTVCNGAENSGSCKDMLIIVPPNPSFLFLHSLFPHEDSDDSIPFAGSIDGLRIVCSGNEMCTDWTTFPLLWDAIADKNIDNKTFYYYGNYSYNYLFKKIVCASGQQCYIDCKGSYTCSSTYIECEEGSKCYIECDDEYQCDNMVIKAYGDDVELKCGAAKACNDMRIWVPTAYDGLDLSESVSDALLDITFLCKDTNDTGVYVALNGTDGGYECDNTECCPSIGGKGKGNDQHKHGSTALVVALVFAVLIVLLIGVCVVIWINKRKKEQTEYVQMQDPLINN